MIDIPKYYGMSLAVNTLAAQQSADDKKKREEARLAALKRVKLLKLAGQFGFLVKQTKKPNISGGSKRIRRNKSKTKKRSKRF